jgi:parvulin-like peptidyl-prolyl isomerase
VAAKYSEAYNASEGGMNDWTTQGALRDEELDRALFTLPVGALSPIIETVNGFHIVRVVERRQAGHTPFAEVQDDIRQELLNADFRKKTEAFITKLRRETRIWTLYTGDTTAEAFLMPPGGQQRY